MLRGAHLIPYSTADYPLARLAAAVFGVSDLPGLHRHLLRTRRGRGRTSALSYADNLALRKLLQDQPQDSGLFKVYHALVTEVLAPLFGGKLRYTLHPKFRVHLAGTESVSKWHRDTDYTGRVEQINAWLPFTDCYDTNTLWVETDYGKGDYEPVDVAYGEVLLFDGGFLSHGTVPNTTDTTRVSLDFRFHALRGDLREPDLGILTRRPPGLEPSLESA